MLDTKTDNEAPIGVLVAQLGTPAAPTAKALRPYAETLHHFVGALQLSFIKALVAPCAYTGIKAGENDV